MDEVSLMIQESEALKLERAQVEGDHLTDPPEIDPSTVSTELSSHAQQLDAPRLWSLLERSNGDEEVSVEEVAYAWQQYLTLPEVEWSVFPGLYTLAQLVTMVTGRQKITLPDLCMLETCVGPFSVAFEKMKGLVYDAQGRHKEYFHEYIKSSDDANKMLQAQPKGTFLFWIDPDNATGLQVSYVYDDRQESGESIRVLSIENAGVQGFICPKGDTFATLDVEEIVTSIGSDTLTQPCAREIPIVASNGVNIQPALEVEEVVAGVSLRQSDPYEDPLVEFSDFLTADDLGRLEKDMREHGTNGKLLEEKLQTGADVFGDAQFKLAAKLFVEILVRVASWQKEESYLDKVDHSRNHVIHASCLCSICTAVHYTACAYGNLGHVYFAMKELQKAVVYFEKSLPLLREIGLWKESPKVLSRLFECSLRLKDIGRIRAYGIQKIGCTQRNKNREALLLQMKEACGPQIEGGANGTIEAAKGAHLALMNDKMISSMFHFGRALDAARLSSPSAEARYLEAKALVYIGAVCYSMARTSFALVHLEEALLLLRGGKCGTAGAELQKVALSSVVEICETAGWNKAAMKYRHELTVLAGT